jgi:hypothetical protein
LRREVVPCGKALKTRKKNATATRVTIFAV